MRKMVIGAFIFLGVFVVSVLFFIHPKRYTKIEGVNAKTPEQLYQDSFVDEKYKNPPQIFFDEETYVPSNNFDISAKYSFAIDLSNDRILFAKDIHKPVPVASLVKVMTAVVTLEHASANFEIMVSEKAANMEPNSMGIAEGEIYNIKDLLYGLILNSGNDAAIAIAEGVGGSEENFTVWMNLKAQELGLKNTKFIDPNGLNLNDKEYYSSAYDLAVLSKYALDTFPLLREIFSTFNYEFPETSKHKYLYLENLTNLITTYPGVKGIKIGYTPSAGNTLITYAENENAKILGVLLDSENQRYDAILLLDYCFNKEGVSIEHSLIY
ncbi:MAG: D-alanyl-D-alanine carboxypeptidase family protein [bacterium]